MAVKLKIKTLLNVKKTYNIQITHRDKQTENQQTNRHKTNKHEHTDIKHSDKQKPRQKDRTPTKKTKKFEHTEAEFKEFEPRLKFESRLKTWLVPLKTVFNASIFKPAPN